MLHISGLAYGLLNFEADISQQKQLMTRNDAQGDN